MPRILIWNVNNFSERKINNPANLIRSGHRLNYMLHVFTDVNVDIIVILEVSATNDFLTWDGTTLRPGNGRNGASNILNCLRILQPLANWCMVPLLNLGCLGFREGIAVYFRSAILEFTGPYVWTGDEPIHNAGIPRSVPPAAGRPLGNYAAFWAGCLPAGNVSVGSHHNAGTAQNQCAAQFQYFDNAGNEIFFPTGRGGGGIVNPPQSRAPLLTTFFDPVTTLNYKLFSMHTSPATANQAIQNLADVEELTNAALANEVTVIAGDFNVDTYTPANLGPAGYGAVTALGYQLLIDSRDAGAINQLRRPYTMTHLLPLPPGPAGGAGITSRATPYTTSAPPGRTPNLFGGLPAAGDSPGGPYPSFGYMGTMSGFGFNRVSYAASIDNAMVRYHGGVLPPGHQTTIVNPVVGSPYNAAGFAAPGNAPIGAHAYPHLLINALPVPGGLPRPAAGFLHPLLVQTRQWNNFGRLRNTSDHLAVVFDV